MDGHTQITVSATQGWPRPFLGISALGFFSTRVTGLANVVGAPIPVPANDHSYYSDTDPTLSWAPVLWLDLIEIDGHVLLAANVDGDIEAFRELRDEIGAREAEMAVNTIFLDQLLDTDRHSESTLVEFGTLICKNLRARAARAFPGRAFVTELFATADANRIGVRLYQNDTAVS